MIQAVLQKCLDNLNAENPDLSYVRGMIEVLLAMHEKPKESHGKGYLDGRSAMTDDVISVSPALPPEANPEPDEASLLDARAKASLEFVKKASMQE